MISGRWRVEQSVERANLCCQRWARKTHLYCPQISTSSPNINFNHREKNRLLITTQWTGKASISRAADSLELLGQTGQTLSWPPELTAHSWQEPALSDGDKSVRVDWDRDPLRIHPADSLTPRKPANCSFISLSRWVNLTYVAQTCHKYWLVMWPRQNSESETTPGQDTQSPQILCS